MPRFERITWLSGTQIGSGTKNGLARSSLAATILSPLLERTSFLPTTGTAILTWIWLVNELITRLRRHTRELNAEVGGAY